MSNRVITRLHAQMIRRLSLQKAMKHRRATLEAVLHALHTTAEVQAGQVATVIQVHDQVAALRIKGPEVIDPHFFKP